MLMNTRAPTSKAIPSRRMIFDRLVQFPHRNREMRIPSTIILRILPGFASCRPSVRRSLAYRYKRAIRRLGVWLRMLSAQPRKRSAHDENVQ
jgi:hypothetical protein